MDYDYDFDIENDVVDNEADLYGFLEDLGFDENDDELWEPDQDYERGFQNPVIPGAWGSINWDEDPTSDPDAWDD